MERVIGHLDMDAFFAAVEQRDDPALRGKPVIIGADPRQGRGRGVVATCSYEARIFGIHSAMPISEAYRRCPRGIYLRGNGQKYRFVSRQVFDILRTFTPLVQPVSIDEAYLDLTGTTRLHGSPLQAAGLIKTRIYLDTGLTASVGIAPTKMAAKIASDLKKPDGLVVVSPEMMMDFLRPLSVSKIPGVGPKARQSLERLGIKTIGDIERTPPDRLRSALGVHGLRLCALAHGLDPRDVHEDNDIKSVSHEHTFETDTGNYDEVIAVVSALCEKVSRRLRRAGLKGRTVTVKIRLASFRTYSRAKTLEERIHFYESIFDTARGLTEAFYQPGMKVRLVGVKVHQFENPYVRDTLFSSEDENRKEKIHQAVDQIKDKFGEHAIKRGIISS